MMMNLTDIRPGMMVSSTYAHLTDEQRREEGLAKLQTYITGGRMRAARVMDAIMQEVPHDRLVRANALRFAALEDGLRVVIGGQPAEIHQHALDQAAERTGLNRRYMHELMGQGSAWANQLIAHNLNELLIHQTSESRYMVRDVGSRVRAVLSDAYRRIDSRPTVEAFATAARDAKAILVDGIYTETRVSLKVVRPQPVEVFPGEWMVFGVSYANSDFGDGASEFSSFLLRLACLNGAVAARELRRVHLGRRLSADDAASERTLCLDALTQASLARDQVHALLTDGATETLVNQIRQAHNSAIEPKAIAGFLRARTSKTEAGAIVEKFDSADVVELPPGQSAWRLSNAISWLAKNTEDDRRRMELERIAGEAIG
jgi:hypothetical protein